MANTHPTPAPLPLTNRAAQVIPARRPAPAAPAPDKRTGRDLRSPERKEK